MVAIAYSVLAIIYHVLSGKKGYEELRGNYFDERGRKDTEKRLVRRLEKRADQVSLRPPVPCSQESLKINFRSFVW